LKFDKDEISDNVVYYIILSLPEGKQMFHCDDANSRQETEKVFRQREMYKKAKQKKNNKNVLCLFNAKFSPGLLYSYFCMLSGSTLNPEINTINPLPSNSTLCIGLVVNKQS
jgi:hypothetical protein